MARSRLYGWNGEYPEKALSGQALIVFNGLRTGTVDGAASEPLMLTGHDWADRIGSQLATRQDPYRVVLYYILVLKNRGVVKTAEFDIDATTRVGDERTIHGVTVKTEAAVVERFATPAPAPDESVTVSFPGLTGEDDEANGVEDENDTDETEDEDDEDEDEESDEAAGA